jgi:hypothetical protein
MRGAAAKNTKKHEGGAGTRGETETDGDVRNMGGRKMGQDESALADAGHGRSEVGETIDGSPT